MSFKESWYASSRNKWEYDSQPCRPQYMRPILFYVCLHCAQGCWCTVVCLGWIGDCLSSMCPLGFAVEHQPRLHSQEDSGTGGYWNTISLARHPVQQLPSFEYLHRVVGGREVGYAIGAWVPALPKHLCWRCPIWSQTWCFTSLQRALRRGKLKIAWHPWQSWTCLMSY